MNDFEVPSLPRRPGSYLWLYADVCAGEWTAVAIFLVGSVFSPRYAARPQSAPSEHCAVNFALYRRGRRVRWALTEYPSARSSGNQLGIGHSLLTYRDGRLEIDVDERSAPWGPRVQARLVLESQSSPIAGIALDSQQAHRWEPRMIRARATLESPGLVPGVEGLGYHDLNSGEEPLGPALRGWNWACAHGPHQSSVFLALQKGPVFSAKSSDGLVAPEAQGPAQGSSRSGWGLAIPSQVPTHQGLVPRGHLLESSPFYARHQHARAGLHVLGEVADFRRFRSPYVRWMAHFRSRSEAA